MEQVFAENSRNNFQEPTQLVNQQVTYKTDKKIIYLLSTLLFCSIIIIGYLLWMNLNKTEDDDFKGYITDPISTPVANITNIDQFIKSNVISYNGLTVPYPKTWTPIFASLNNDQGERKIYFAENEIQSNNLIECSKQNNCTNYLASLEISSSHAVWQNYSLENFIKATNKKIDITKLQKSSLNGYETWQGFSDPDNLVYNFIIGNEDLYGYLIIKSDNKDYLDKIVSLTKDIRYSELKDVDITKLSNTKAFLITFNTLLNIPNNSMDITSYVLPSLFGGGGINSSNHYSLYVDTTTQNYPTQDNVFSGSYYLLTDQHNLSVGNYGTAQIQISLEKLSKENMNKYLSNKKYCEADNDCLKTANFCTVGVFNKYHQYISPWGCGPAEYESLGNSMTFDDKLKCETDLKFDSIKCVNNSCLGVNPQAVCK